MQTIEKKTIRPMWRRVLNWRQDRNIQSAGQEMATWADEYWQKWDKNKQRLLDKFSDLTEEEAKYVSWAQIRCQVPSVQKKEWDLGIKALNDLAREKELEETGFKIGHQAH